MNMAWRLTCGTAGAWNVAAAFCAALGCSSRPAEPTTVQAISTKGCLRERGCSPPQPQPRQCEAATTAIPVEQVLKAPDPLLGRQVALRGALQVGGTLMTLMMCGREMPCCNQSSAELAIRALGEKSLDRMVVLENEQAPRQFSCTGDDSMVCCGLDARGQEVIASGLLTRGGAPPSLRLASATVCAP